jgi:hypothetical protein
VYSTHTLDGKQTRLDLSGKQLANMSPFVRSLAVGAVWAAVGLAATIPFLLWGNDKAPEFYGAFMAAIVAAIAVVLGAYYQAELTRRRDDEIAQREEIAAATDLFFWLGHAIREMEFIEDVLRRFHSNLQDNESKLDLTLDRFREVVSSHFMDDLRQRAQIAARLSPRLGAEVAPILYDTFLAADRIYRFRGASETGMFSRETLDKHIFVTTRRISELRKAQDAVGTFLSESGVIIIRDDDHQSIIFIARLYVSRRPSNSWNSALSIFRRRTIWRMILVSKP